MLILILLMMHWITYYYYYSKETCRFYMSSGFTAVNTMHMEKQPPEQAYTYVYLPTDVQL